MGRQKNTLRWLKNDADLTLHIYLSREGVHLANGSTVAEVFSFSSLKSNKRLGGEKKGKIELF